MWIVGWCSVLLPFINSSLNSPLGIIFSLIRTSHFHFRLSGPSRVTHWPPLELPLLIHGLQPNCIGLTRCSRAPDNKYSACAISAVLWSLTVCTHLPVMNIICIIVHLIRNKCSSSSSSSSSIRIYNLYYINHVPPLH